MKHFTTALALILAFGFGQNARAEFGSFFTGQAPAGLEESPQDVLSEILAIEPAAGEEQQDDSVDINVDAEVKDGNLQDTPQDGEHSAE